MIKVSISGASCHKNSIILDKGCRCCYSVRFLKMRAHRDYAYIYY